MDENKIDIDILHNYNFDLAFGSDENDFELKIALTDHCCKAGYIPYIDGTEYGGIIDKIIPDTKTNKVTYGGRTWHGVLEKKVISPDSGEDYLYLTGEANEVLAFLIVRMGLSDLFSASTEDSGIEIVNYPVRYGTGYTVIRKMLYEFGGKLKITFSKGYAVLSAVPYIDYSKNEEWDSSQLSFKITKNYKAVNHLICLGRGNLKDRHVIHLFTDANGGIQPYTTAEVPVKNTDYILDTSKQVLFDEDEICEVYDLSNAQDTTNYVLLAAEPDDWENTYSNFYKQKDDDSYEALKSWMETVYTLQLIQPADWAVNYKDYHKKDGNDYESVESLSQTVYTMQTAQPSDWDSKYADYFTKSGSSYPGVTGITTESYRKQTKKPSDWSKNYGNYYYYYSDGVTAEYRKVSGIIKYKYVAQTMKPTDWETNFKSYYARDNDNKYIELTELKKWKAKRYYTKESYAVAPSWSTNYYYTYSKTVSAPTWSSNKYYTKGINTVPTWESGTYYTKSTETFIPQFVENTYFQQFVDNYAELVSGGVEKLEESYDCDKIAISLDPSQEYDVNDIVGANENITGIMVWQPITKKIVKIDDYHETIEYKIGD
ncbi:MAG TPA: hypothetical protein VHO72_10665 [Bacteroidales bacterium]|nr:hypothetical protein [Bacteroidales bacterium]